MASVIATSYVMSCLRFCPLPTASSISQQADKTPHTSPRLYTRTY